MQVPQINTSAIANQSVAREASNTRLNANTLVDPNQFTQVMDLMAPKEVVTPIDDQQEMSQNVEDTTPRVQESTEESSDTVQQNEVVRSKDETRQHVKQESTDPQGEQATHTLDSQQQAKLKLLAQMSREDLLQLVQWQQNSNQMQVAQSEQLTNPELSHFKDMSTGDLMALLNGFQHAQQPEFQTQGQIEFPQLQWLESQLLQTQNQSAQGLAQNIAQMNQMQMQLNNNQTNVMQAVMPAVTRPQEVMPMLNVLRLTQAQKEGVVRQVARGFKSQSNGTQSAEIRLHPEELGMVKLKVEMRGNDVRVFFSAENQLVGDLLTQNIDQLKSLLGDQEFNLVEAGLFQDQLADQQEHAHEEGEDYGSDDRPDLKHRPKRGPRMSPLPGRFRATV